MEKASLEESAEASILFFALLCAVQCGVAIRCANERVVSSFTNDVGCPFWGGICVWANCTCGGWKFLEMESSSLLDFYFNDMDG